MAAILHAQHLCMPQHHPVFPDQLRRRFLAKPKSLAAVIQDDERLAGLTEGEILAEVRAQVCGLHACVQGAKQNL